MRANGRKDMGKMKAIIMAVIAALAMTAWAAMPQGRAATPQERAERLDEVLWKNLKDVGSPSFRKYGYSEKTFYLKRLRGKDAKLVDYNIRVDCLKTSFIGAVHERDAPFAACVLMRIRREVNGFSRYAEDTLVEKAISTARFVDYGESVFRTRFYDDLERCSSAEGFALVRMRAIRIAPFVVRQHTTLADAVRLLSKKAVEADYVNDGMGVGIALELEGAEKVPPKLPKVEVGCRFEGGGVVEWHDVTVEEAVKKVAGSVGYTFNIGSNGVVTVSRAKGHDTK